MQAHERTAKNDPQEELAARLRLLQEVSGLGVRALARDTGLSSSSLSRYLNGQTVPPWPAVVDLCRLVKRDPRPLRPVWERASNPLPAPPKSTRQGRPPARNDLPRDVPDFTGREEQLAAVLAAVESHRAVSVDGMAGVGKTCLAVHAAHRLTAGFPDAQLYVDLHGFTEGRPPLDPAAGCPTGAAHAAASEAWTLLQLGHREEAARLARQVLELAHTDPAWPPGLTARITLGLAVVQEDPEASAEQLRQALTLARDDGHLNNQAWCLNCMGVALRQMGRYEEALASHREAFALLDELFEEHWKIHFLNGYAETYRLAGHPDEALRLHREALELARSLGNRHAEALALEGIRELRAG
ncbi:helix-turn-helix protein [Streptomyces puniciscabiei]|uniref:Helix-turn-helix protein n=1 Tax=Streptomyces puniciscabiei TaxID=164348 RepID=A0A542UMH7_9ACTN|nr:tetratricopeptide repeat protein [Streptomyces puniciscabiei]TQL00291.1 helix-turn-helix protein [Streptomyces puniciscabiei]